MTLSLSPVFQDYAAKRAIEAADEAAIKRAEQRIAKLRKRLEAKTGTSWVDDLAKPFARRIADALGYAHVDVAGPFGLGCRLSVYLLPYAPAEDERVYDVPDSIRFVLSPDDLDKGRLSLVNEAKQVRYYPPNSLGAINRLGCEELPIPQDITLPGFLSMLGLNDKAAELVAPSARKEG